MRQLVGASKPGGFRSWSTSPNRAYSTMRNATGHYVVGRCAWLAFAIAWASLSTGVGADEFWSGDVTPVEELSLAAAMDGFYSSGIETDRYVLLPEEHLPQAVHASPAAGSDSDERLIDRTTDPTAWLTNLRLRYQWNWPVEAADPDAQAIQLRPTIPFLAWGHVNLLRVSVPYDISGADGAGLGDVEIFDLIVWQESWGRWGVGPSLRLTDDDFQAGPAAGFVSKNKHWTVGALTQNYLSDDASQSRLQPILAYKFDQQWAISIGESEFRYDWDDDRWSQLPLGVQIERIANVYGQKIQFFTNPQYNFQRDSSNSGWTLFLGFSLLIPDA